MTTLKCDGACEDYDAGEHRGEVRLVHVNGWGYFNYCEEAIKEDQRRGLIVTMVNPEHDDPWLSGDDMMGSE